FFYRFDDPLDQHPFPTRRSSDLEDQRRTLQRRAEQERAQATDAIGDPAKSEAADDTEAEHHRDDLGAALGAVAEIGAIRDHVDRSEEHTSELQSQSNLVCRLLLE